MKRLLLGIAVAACPAVSAPAHAGETITIRPDDRGLLPSPTTRIPEECQKIRASLKQAMQAFPVPDTWATHHDPSLAQRLNETAYRNCIAKDVH
jgi:hypothetical protein